MIRRSLLLLLFPLTSFSQVDSLKNARLFVHVNGFFMQDHLTTFRPDSIQGRINTIYLGGMAGIRFCRIFYAGFKVQYNLFKTLQPYAVKYDNQHGITAGPFLGISHMKANKSFYFMARIHLLASNISFTSTPDYDYAVATNELTLYGGTEAEIGLKLLPRIYVFAGLSINNPLPVLNNTQGTKKEFNYPYAGFVIPVYSKTSHYSKTIFKRTASF